MSERVGLPFIVKAKDYETFIKFVNKLKENYGFMCNKPLQTNGHNGTHGDFHMLFGFFNIVNKSYWLGMPGVSFCEPEFDVFISNDEFMKILKIYENAKKSKINDLYYII